VAKIKWNRVHYRSDIGKKALVRMQAVPRVGIVMGSDSDLKVMEGALGIFKKFGIPIEMTVASAHRSPDRATTYAAIGKGAGTQGHHCRCRACRASGRGAGCPHDATGNRGPHRFVLPPGIRRPAFHGTDAAGNSRGDVSIGKPGAKNAAILAVQIMAVSDDDLAAQLEAFKKEMAVQVEKKAETLRGYR
jgi:phosphoribosylamine--glycine ligase